MKKLFPLFMLMLLACNMLAQDLGYPSVSASALSREGNKYYFNGEKISRRDCQAYLHFYADQATYKKFRSGRQMYNVGWAALGTGIALDVFALGFTMTLSPNNPDALFPNLKPMLGLLFVTVPTAASGLALTITGIPLVCAGQKKMTKSFDAYNISLPSDHIQPELRVQANNNGLGLVCSF